jgi:hypothetical protein
MIMKAERNARLKFTMGFILMMLSSNLLLAQDDLLNQLLAEKEPVSEFAEATFKGSRLINGHSVITRKQGDLEFLIAHRFGQLNSGAYELWGLDNSNIRFGLEYGLNDRLTIGAGRNSFEKTFDGFLKYGLLRQQSGARVIPVSITAMASAAVKTLKPIDKDQKNKFSDKLVYTYQLLIARKLTSAISLQLMPTMLHRNLVEGGVENDVFALGAGGRLKLSQRVSFNAEYYYRFETPENDAFHNSLAVGFDIETGGHVFQLHLTNSRSMIEKGFITETEGDFLEGDIHFGFNITRVF